MSLRLLGASSLALSLALGCSSTGTVGAPEPYVPSPDTDAQDDIGFFLADFQSKMQLWNKLKLELDPGEDPREFHALERDLKRRARKRLPELIETLEGGAPINRSTAAVALGFTLYAEAVSPLLAALADDDENVAQNAALGLGLLAWPRTNLAPLRYQLETHPHDGVRNNAAYALLEIASEARRRDHDERASGVTPLADAEISAEERRERDAALAKTCREGLQDAHEGVRVQCAAILGLLRDAQAVAPLLELLYDEWNLPARAAATSLVHIAREHAEHRGPVARGLLVACDRVEDERCDAFRRQLARLSGRNFGDDMDEWREWAYRLP
ncbi:MAG: HEAT repeat domain-containing protein [Planctomycetota bacterium]